MTTLRAGASSPGAAGATGATGATAEHFYLHPVASLLLDADGAIIDANQEAEGLFVRSRAHLAGMRATSLVAADKRESLARVIAEPGTSARLFAIELDRAGRTPVLADVVLGAAIGSGQQRLLALHQVPPSARERPVRPGAAARSATAAAAMLAHEIKNPLSGIRGAAQLLGRQVPIGTRPLADLICGEVDRIAALIDSMQDFTRDAAVAVTPLNIFPAIAQAREIAQAGFAADVRFEEWFDPSVPPVLAHHDSLVQLLLNLIKNASEAAVPGRRATIRLTAGYRHGFAWDAGDGRGHVALPVEIAVLDDGPGVPAAVADALFDPFVSGKKDGQGLGLALVDKLMRDMHGLIQHDRVGQWTRFRLAFRAAPVGQGES